MGQNIGHSERFPFIVKILHVREWYVSQGLTRETELVEMGFPGGAVVESLPATAGHTGLSPGLGRSHSRGATRPVSHNY